MPLFRYEDGILAQGAMTVLSLSLDRSDVILNAYPFTGTVGLGLGLAPWLIGGAKLVQHHPFEYGVFADQLLNTGATVTAMPSAILASWARTACCRTRAASFGGWGGSGRQRNLPIRRRR
ncbi:hypothetical protein AUC71_03985 [Methyloceanibacter marginalis]|uniref:AMP-dependent synthetase/ligase domain-containing protein n=1 Tax=Methyloceanibacter marginalis TaxID=1774971 RepID=A0A1E3VVI6_9HYPH|nr:hypothetical protein [Methyloceanibacter marginalis]ODR97568.1 hypothetical protein AUC71_03985 [Methyloceanibacter marginalis]